MRKSLHHGESFLWDCLGVQVNKLTTAGCVFKFWVADWFALMNNKVRAVLGRSPWKV